MLNTILKYGAIAGILVAIPTYGVSVAFHDSPPDGAIGMAIGYASMLVAMSFVFMGVKHHRDSAGGGIIGFWPALGIGIAISLVAGIFYVLAWEAALATTGMDFAAKWGEQLVADARARGDSPAAIAKLRTEMAQFARDYANPLYRLPVTFSEILPVGILVALVSAGLLRNSRFLPAR